MGKKEVREVLAVFLSSSNSIEHYFSAHQPAKAVGVQQQHGHRSASAIEPVQSRRLAVRSDDGERRAAAVTAVSISKDLRRHLVSRRRPASEQRWGERESAKNLSFSFLPFLS